MYLQSHIHTLTHTYSTQTEMMSKCLELLLSWRTSIQSPKPMYNCEYAEQSDPWASPSSLPSLCGELLASQRTALPCTGRELPEKQHSKLTSVFIYIHFLTHTHIYTCAHTHSGVLCIVPRTDGLWLSHMLVSGMHCFLICPALPLSVCERWFGHSLPIYFEQRHNRSIWRSLLFKRKGEIW